MSAHSGQFRYTMRTALLTVTVLGAYLALAKVYGFGRAVLCLLNLSLVFVASLFLIAAWYCWVDEQRRNALAATTLALLILGGAVLVASVVFR